MNVRNPSIITSGIPGAQLFLSSKGASTTPEVHELTSEIHGQQVIIYLGAHSEVLL